MAGEAERSLMVEWGGVEHGGILDWITALLITVKVRVTIDQVSRGGRIGLPPKSGAVVFSDFFFLDCSRYPTYFACPL